MRIENRPWGVVLLVITAACGKSDQTAPDPVARKLDELRDVTRAFSSFDAGRAAGFDVKITDCMSDAQGGMGLHYGNGARIDGVPNELEPEVLMYEPQANGQLKLVGVEFVIPFTAWTQATPPSLYGESFQRNEMFKVWALHAWIFQDNPRGVFASWNPSVSCAHAAAVKN